MNDLQVIDEQIAEIQNRAEFLNTVRGQSKASMRFIEIFAVLQSYGYTIGRIGFHVTDIIDVEHSYAEQADSGSRQDKFPGIKGVDTDIIRSEYAHKPEKDEDENISESPVSIGVSA